MRKCEVFDTITVFIMKYTHAALGGTFDHLHIGHKYIIDFALENAEKVSIAIATANLYKNKDFNETIEHFSYRKEMIEEYLKLKNVLNRITFYELNDIYGPTLTDDSLDSIVVTYETEPNAVRINEERERKGLAPLALLMCPFVKGPNENIIRSTNIRSGSTDRTGFPYASLFNAKILYLPKSQRPELRKPLAQPIFLKDEHATAAKVVNILKENTILTIGVGDIVNKTLVEAGFTPDIQIIDFKTRRQDIQPNSDTETNKRFRNDPGTLLKSTVVELNSSIRQFIRDKVKQTIVIEGEEDLLTLPAILFAPLNAHIVYGQFEEGIVVVRVTEELKQKVTKIVNQFTTTP